MSETLRVYDRVRVKEPLPVWMRHFPAGEAIISGRGDGGFTLTFQRHGEVSWFGPSEIELIERHKPELLDQWEQEILELRDSSD